MTSTPLFYPLIYIESIFGSHVNAALKKDSHEDVREGAVHVLGKLDDARAVEPLISRLDDNHRVRKEAANALLSLFRSRALSDAQKRAILGNRGKIVNIKHEDLPAVCAFPHEDSKFSFPQ